MTAGQHIDYDALQLEALRGVIKACLAQVSRSGLLGDHHFYIAFNTQAPGVGMSKRLKEKYPVEMTIVLQHRFWDLAVDDDRFEVKLTFDGIPERLVVPFKAVKVFYDPSVPYGLQFEEADATQSGDGARSGSRRAIGVVREGGGQAGAADGDAASRKESREADDTLPTTAERRRSPRKARPEKPDEPRIAEPASVAASGEARPEGREPQPSSQVPAPVPAKPAIVAVVKNEQAAKPDAGGEQASGAKIFDLSKFRGKK